MSSQQGNSEIDTDKHGVQRKAGLQVELLLFKSVAFLAATGLCLWVGFRPRASWPTQAGMAAFSVMVSVPFFRLAMENLSLGLETRRRNRAERKSWKMCERRIYRHAVLFATTGDSANRADDPDTIPRQVCVVEHNASERTNPTLLFVHGSMAQLAQFDSQIQHFRKLGFHVVAYDYFGCGRSPKPDMDAIEYSPNAHLHDLVRVYEHFCAPRPSGTFIVSHSFGTSQTLRLLEVLQRKKNVTLPLGVALLGTIANLAGQDEQFAAKAEAQRLKLTKIFGLPLAILRFIQPILSAGFAQRALHENTRNLSSADPDIKAAHAKLMRYAKVTNGRTPMHVASPFYLQLQVIESKVLSSGAVPRIPALLITGNADLLTPPTNAEGVISAWKNEKAALEIVKGAGHQVMQEQPTEVNKLLQAFIKKIVATPEAAQAVARALRDEEIAKKTAAVVDDDVALDAAYTALTANGSVEIEEVRGIVAAQPTESNRGAPEKVVTLWVRGTKQSHTQVFTVRATLSDVPGSTEVVGVTVEDGARSKDDSFIKGPPGFRAWTDGEALEQAGWVSLPRRQKIVPAAPAAKKSSQSKKND